MQRVLAAVVALVKLLLWISCATFTDAVLLLLLCTYGVGCTVVGSVLLLLLLLYSLWCWLYCCWFCSVIVVAAV